MTKIVTEWLGFTSWDYINETYNSISQFSFWVFVIISWCFINRETIVRPHILNYIWFLIYFQWDILDVALLAIFTCCFVSCRYIVYSGSGCASVHELLIAVGTQNISSNSSRLFFHSDQLQAKLKYLFTGKVFGLAYSWRDGTNHNYLLLKCLLGYMNTVL